MPLETGDFVTDLNTAQPAQGDAVAQGVGHLTLIKHVVKNSFPNINGQVLATPDNLNNPLIATARPAIASTSVPSPDALLPFLDTATTANTCVFSAFGQSLVGLANAASLATTLDLGTVFVQKAGDTMTGGLVTPSIDLGSNMVMAVVSTVPVMQLAAGVSISYDATNTQIVFSVGGAPVVTISATGEIKATGNVDGGATL